MIKSALKCLNLVAELSLINIQTNLLTQDQKANIGAKHFFIGNLTCVVNITNRIKFPGQWELFGIYSAANAAPGSIGSTVQYSIFNIVQYYVKPHLHLCPYLTDLQLEALYFLVICCRIWQTQPLGERVSLESTLRTIGVDSSEQRMRYIMNFKACLRVSQGGAPSMPLKYLSTFFDLLIVASTTQSAFVSDIFKE